MILGSLYGMMAIGLTVTYMTTKVPNFAFGSFVAIGAYSSFYLFVGNRLSPYISAPVAFVFSGLSAVLMYILVLRPMIRRGSSLVSLMIATLAADLIFTGVINIVASYIFSRLKVVYAYSFPKVLADFWFMPTWPPSYGYPNGSAPPGGQGGLLLVAPMVLGGMAVFLYFLLFRTKFGMAMRAAVENPNLAKTVGINIERVNMLAWFLAGGLAGTAGALYVLNNGGSSDLGTLLIVEIFAASVLGGLTSVFGAMAGGIIVGASETVFVFWGVSIFGSNFADFQKGIPLLAMIITLLVLPQGLSSLRFSLRGRGSAK